MSKKKIIPFLAAAAIGGAVALTGCSLSGPNGDNAAASSAAAETTTQTADIEKKLPALEAVALTSRWYNASGSRLAGTTVTIFDGKTQLYTGQTNGEGTLDALSVPTGKNITFFLTDKAGTTIASSDILFTSSSDYSENVIVPLRDGESAQTIEIAPDSSSVIASMYIDESGIIRVSSISRDLSALQAQQPAEDASEEAAAAEDTDLTSGEVESADDIIKAADEAAS